MKKVFVLAAAALLVTASSFAHGDKKKDCDKDCCKKECKKTEKVEKKQVKTAVKETKTAVKLSAKKALPDLISCSYKRIKKPKGIKKWSNFFNPFGFF